MLAYLSGLRAKLLLAALVAAFGLALVACGGGQSATPTASPAITGTPTVSAQALSAPGPFAVGVTTLTFVDDSRPTDANGSYPGAPSRTLVTEVWYPAEGTPPTEGASSIQELRGAPLDRTEAPYPLIVFSHGLTSFRRQSVDYTTHLASRGYVVVSADYPLTNLSAPGGARMGDVLNQPADVSFLIDSVLGLSDQTGSQLEGAINEDAIGLTGHSLGGLTTLLTTFGPLRDPRVKAALSISAPACLVGETTYQTPAVPLLVMSGSNDGIVVWDSARAAYDMARPPKYLLGVLGANHLRFADFDAEDSVAGDLQSLPGFMEDAIRIGTATGADLASCVTSSAPGLPAAPPMTLARQHELMNLFGAAFFGYYLKDNELAGEALTPSFMAGIPDLQVEENLGSD